MGVLEGRVDGVLETDREAKRPLVVEGEMAGD
jgi:hypothetical protein